MVKLSQYVSLEEAIKSQMATRMGIRNEPSEVELAAMRYVASSLFDPVRAFVGGALAVSSFFRCAALNNSIGGSATSQHCKGQAIDIDADVYGVKREGNHVLNPNRMIFNFIRDNLEFDQLIWEFGTTENPDWVHVSKTRGANRGQVLRAYRENGKTHYVTFDLY